MTPEDQEKLIKRYLLLELEPEERDRFEERYFSDSELLGRLLEMESDMVDDYATSRMSEDEKSRFEKSLESLPERRARIQNARGFLTSLKDLPRPDMPASAPASFKDRIPFLLRFPIVPRIAIAVSLLLVGVTIITVIVTQTKKDVAIDQGTANKAPNAATPESAADELRAEDSQRPTPKSPEKATSIATFILSPGGFRGGEGSIPRVTGRGAAGTVRIGMRIPNDFSSTSYAVKLDGQTFLESVRPTNFEGQAEMVLVNLDLSKTAPGKHVLTLVSLEGAEENYLFITAVK